MEREESRNDPPQPAERSADRNPLKLVLGVLLALIPGMSIVLILNVLNRSGWFSLLSGLSGMVLSSLLTFVQWISGRSLRRKTPHSNQDKVGPEARQAFLVQTGPWLLLYGLLAIAGGLGLFFLSDQQSPVFAVISGVLGLLLCISAFRFLALIGLSVLVLFVAEKMERRFASPVDERTP